MLKIQDQQGIAMTQQQEIKRLKEWVQDRAQYCPYPELRREAAAVLDYSQPVQRIVPPKGLAIGTKQY